MNKTLAEHMMELATTTPSAVWVFWFLVNQRNDKGLSMLPRSALSKTEVRRVESGLTILRERGMVSRMGRGWYQVNPELGV